MTEFICKTFCKSAKLTFEGMKVVVKKISVFDVHTKGIWDFDKQRNTYVCDAIMVKS